MTEAIFLLSFCLIYLSLFVISHVGLGAGWIYLSGLESSRVSASLGLGGYVLF